MTQSELMVIPNFLVTSERLALFLGKISVTFGHRPRGKLQASFPHFRHTASSLPPRWVRNSP